MRYAAALFLIALSGCATSRVTRSPAESRPCTARVAGEVRAGEVKVPKYLYHYGRKSILDRNVAARTVPAADWRDAIFGESTTWSLPRFRRGLYGVERALRADVFANREDPAVMRIEVAEGCRDPRRVATTYGLADDPRFERWAGPAGAAAFRAACVKRDGSLNARHYAKLERESPSAGVLDCEAKIDAFLDGAGMRIVQDEPVEASWYIRDRACIRTVVGTDAELFTFFAEPEFFSADRCGSPTESLASFRIFARAMLRARPAPATVAPAVRNWAAADLDSPATPIWIRSFADAYARCFPAGRLDELAEAYAEVDADLAGIENYDYWTRTSGESVDVDFAKICR